MTATKFDDPGQPPPRAVGVGWMRVPLPDPPTLVLWRASTSGQIDANVRYSGSEGLDIHEAVAGDRDAVAREFAEAGIAAPGWQQAGEEASAFVALPSQVPWDAAREDEQISLLGHSPTDTPGGVG